MDKFYNLMQFTNTSGQIIVSITKRKKERECEAETGRDIRANTRMQFRVHANIFTYSFAIIESSAVVCGSWLDSWLEYVCHGKDKCMEFRHVS